MDYSQRASRLFLVFPCLLVFFQSTSFGLTFDIGDNFGFPGDTIHVEVFISEVAAPFSSFGIGELSYDRDFELVAAVKTGTLVADWVTVVGEETGNGEGRVYCIATTGTPVSRDGILVILEFDIDGGAGPGSYPVTPANFLGAFFGDVGLAGSITVLSPGEPTPILTPTWTPTRTATFTVTPTPTNTGTPTPTPTATATCAPVPPAVTGPSPSDGEIEVARRGTILAWSGEGPGGAVGRSSAVFGVLESSGYDSWAAMHIGGLLDFTAFPLSWATVAASDGAALRASFDVIYYSVSSSSGDFANLRAHVAPGGSLETFTNLGGVLVLNVAANQGSQPNIAPGGLDYNGSTYHEDASFLSPAHPYVTGVGYGGTLLNEPMFDNWSGTDHGTLDDLPPGRVDILLNSDGVSMTEYTFGAGRVIVSTLTLGWFGSPTEHSGPPFDNQFLYAASDFVGSDCPTTYDVYFDTVDPPTTLICDDTQWTFCDPGPLTRCSKYYWQVVANNPLGTTTSPVWSFSTGGCPLSFVNLVSIECASDFPEITLKVFADSFAGRNCGLIASDFELTEDGFPQALDSVLCAASGSLVSDIVLLFDVTGSMDDEIATMKSKATSFANEILGASVDAQFGLVSYSNQLSLDLLLTPDVMAFQAAVNTLSTYGAYEQALDAVMLALGGMPFREGANKIFVVITDDDTNIRGDGGSSAYIMPEVVQAVNAAGGTVFVVSPDFGQKAAFEKARMEDEEEEGGKREESNLTTLKGAANPDERDLRFLAEETGGIWLDLNAADFSLIVDEIVSIITSLYTLVYTSDNSVEKGSSREICVMIADPLGGTEFDCDSCDMPLAATPTVTQTLTPTSTPTPTDTVTPAPTNTPLVGCPGPVAHWALDDASGTTAADSTGNGHHGTLVHGPTWMGQGSVGGALNFDGVDDAIEVADADFGLRSTASVLFWVYVNGDGAEFYQTLVKRGAYAYPFKIRLMGHRLQSIVRTGLGETDYLGSNSLLEWNRWYHVAMTYEADKRVLYLNGSPDSSDAPSGGFFNVGRQITNLGGDTVIDKEYFNGALDDVRIYDTALPPECVLAIYQGGAPTPAPTYTPSVTPTLGPSDTPTPSNTPGPSTTPVPGQTLTPTPSGTPEPEGLKAHWKLDDASGSIALDSTGNGNDGTLLNGPTWVANGIVDGALSFDGADDVVEAGTSEFDLQSEVSILFWVYVAGDGVDYYQTVIRRGLFVYPFQIRLLGHRVQTIIRTGPSGQTHYLTGGTSLHWNRWYHVALTYRNGEEVLYVDGQPDNTNSPTGDLLNARDRVTNLGGDSGKGRHYLNGLLDDVRIHCKALSAQEVLSIYTASAVKPSPSRRFRSPKIDDYRMRGEDITRLYQSLKKGGEDVPSELFEFSKFWHK